MTICSVDGCWEKARTCGWCNPHYQRWYKHGDPTAGQPSPGFARRYLSDVVLKHSEKEECLTWPFATDGCGYGQHKVDGCNLRVHRRVCELVHGAPPTPKHQAAHSCGNSSCVNPHHLSWKTPAENEADKLIHGTHNRGERGSRAKISEDQAREIIALKGVAPHRVIAERYGISASNVSALQRGESWPHLPRPEQGNR